MKTKIFIIDDEADMVEILTDLLESEDYQVASETNPLAGLKKVSANPPDLLLLDIRMKQMNGLEVCRKVKSDPALKSVLIVMLSSKTDESDIVLGLEMGAEDYIRKPVQKGELLARVKTVLRRKEPLPGPGRFSVGPLQLDVPTFTATIDGKSLELRPKEFELLAELARRQGHVVTRSTLSEAVWGREHMPNSHTIESHMYELRRKLGAYAHWIEALKGIGYRFEPDV